jgi:hypothetical protein
VPQYQGTSRTRKGNFPRRLGREGHKLRRTSVNLACARHRAGNGYPRDCPVCGKQHSPPFILGKSSMRKRLYRSVRGAISDGRPYRDNAYLPNQFRQRDCCLCLLQYILQMLAGNMRCTFRRMSNAPVGNPTRTPFCPVPKGAK